MRRGQKVVSDGTDNHIVLLDVSGRGLTGRQSKSALLDSGIVTNRNSVPRDPNGAWYTSGVRLGTPALTTRGLGTPEMDTVAELIDTVLSNTKPESGKDGKLSKAKYVLDPAVVEQISQQAAQLMSEFPLYPTVDLG